jgi:hypothetical protein
MDYNSIVGTNMKQLILLIGLLALIVGLALGFALGRENMRREVAHRLDEAFKGFPPAAEGATATPSSIQDSHIMNEAGHEYKLPTLKLRLDGFAEKRTLTSGFMGPAKAKEGSKFVLVRITVTNTEKEQFFFRPDSEVGIRLVDSQGRRYQESEDNWQGTDDYLGARTLGPGVPEKGTLIYEVPVNAVSYHLEAPQ